MRKPELCKFYQHGYCKKGLQCPLLHGEFPCKAFHKGECSKEQCQYSHVALNEFTQTIFDQMMKDEELASKIMVPAAPVKRKVLLPSGPHEPPRPTPAPASEPMEYVPTPHLPPIADPSMSALLPLQPMPAMPVPETMGAPLDHHAPRPHVEATPAPVVPEMMHVPMQPDVPQPMQMPAEVPRQPEIAPSQAPPAVQEAGDNGPAGFNINDMLAQITQATPVVEDYSAYAPLEEDAYMAPRELNDSPASPSREEHPEPLRVESPLSPTKPVVVPAWRLLPVEVNTEENAIFEEKILQMSQSNSTLRMDPRLRKLLDNQFDRVSSLIGSMAQKTNAPVEEPKSQIQHPPPIATHTAAAAPAPARPDPRVRADPRDPRKRSAADPRDPRLRSDTATPADSAAPSSSSASELRVIYNAADEHALVHGYVDDPAWGTDVDHRPNFNQYGNSPPYHGHDRQYNGSSYNDNYNGPSSYRSSYRGERGDRGERSERGERYRGRGRGHWNRDRPPRESRYHGSRYDYDDEDPRSRRNGSSHTSSSSLAPPAESAVPAAPEQPVAPPQPMSLREKRKDNIYESPLSRPPGGATRY
ncbi:hypothetical protein L596_006255 [Steinernema carpocapsae]|uniref:C3H1-type domain-containing protein n=1 Tax=Steinernema carpocapsae TaxID=34508 RepID=A0A4U8V7K3_STECR|nr:hypothetical protein L596_006255 [Steinernema carpocapsae]